MPKFVWKGNCRRVPGALRGCVWQGTQPECCTHVALSHMALSHVSWAVWVRINLQEPQGMGEQLLGTQTLCRCQSQGFGAPVPQTDEGQSRQDIPPNPAELQPTNCRRGTRTNPGFCGSTNTPPHPEYPNLTEPNAEDKTEQNLGLSPPSWRPQIPS